MTFDDLSKAIDEFSRTSRLFDSMASRIAGLLVGRLRHCSESACRMLKRELRDFDMTTGRWKR